MARKTRQAQSFVVFSTVREEDCSGAGWQLQHTTLKLQKSFDSRVQKVGAGVVYVVAALVRSAKILVG